MNDANVTPQWMTEHNIEPHTWTLVQIHSNGYCEEMYCAEGHLQEHRFVADPERYARFLAAHVVAVDDPAGAFMVWSQVASALNAGGGVTAMLDNSKGSDVIVIETFAANLHDLAVQLDVDENAINRVMVVLEHDNDIALGERILDGLLAA